MTQDKHQPGKASSSTQPSKPLRGESSNTGTEKDLLPELGLKRPAPPAPSSAEPEKNKATRPLTNN